MDFQLVFLSQHKVVFSVLALLTFPLPTLAVLQFILSFLPSSGKGQSCGICVVPVRWSQSFSIRTFIFNFTGLCKLCTLLSTVTWNIWIRIHCPPLPSPVAPSLSFKTNKQKTSKTLALFQLSSIQRPRKIRDFSEKQPVMYIYTVSLKAFECALVQNDIVEYIEEKIVQ